MEGWGGQSDHLTRQIFWTDSQKYPPPPLCRTLIDGYHHSWRVFPQLTWRPRSGGTGCLAPVPHSVVPPSAGGWMRLIRAFQLEKAEKDKCREPSCTCSWWCITGASPSPASSSAVILSSRDEARGTRWQAFLILGGIIHIWRQSPRRLEAFFS